MGKTLTTEVLRHRRKHPEQYRKKGYKGPGRPPKRGTAKQKLLQKQQEMLQEQELHKTRVADQKEDVIKTEDAPADDSLKVEASDATRPSAVELPATCTSVKTPESEEKYNQHAVTSTSVRPSASEDSQIEPPAEVTDKQSPAKEMQVVSDSSGIGLSCLSEASNIILSCSESSGTQVWSVEKVLDTLSNNMVVITSPAKSSAIPGLATASSTYMLASNQSFNVPPGDDRLAQTDKNGHVEIPMVLVKTSFESRTRQYKCVVCETVVEKISQYEDHWLTHIKRDVPSVTHEDGSVPPASECEVVVESEADTGSFRIIGGNADDAAALEAGTSIIELSNMRPAEVDANSLYNDINAQSQAVAIKRPGDVIDCDVPLKKQVVGEVIENGTIDVNKLERILNIDDIISEEVVRCDNYHSDTALSEVASSGNVDAEQSDAYASSGSTSGSEEEDEQSEEISRLISLADDLEIRLKEEQSAVGGGSQQYTKIMGKIKSENSRPDLPLSYTSEDVALSKGTAKIYVCNHCKKTFKNFSSLKRHHEDIHMDIKEGGYDCDLCGKTYAKLRHLRIHKGRMHGNFKADDCTCPECGKKYLQPDYLRNHMRITHAKERDYKCVICRRAFKCNSALKNHMTCVHQKMSLAKYKCPHCWWASDKELDYKKHVAEHEGNPNPYDCKECNKSFKTKSNYQSHMRLHDDNWSIVCEYCGKKMKQSINYRRHLINVHKVESPEKKFKCDRCPREFYSQAGYDNHYRLHNKEKTLTCKECGQTFKNRNLLLMHDRVEHRGISYTCEQCGKLFVYEGKYKEHMERHAKEALSYSCGDCDQEFKNKGLLEHHTKFHDFNAKRKCKRCRLEIHKSYFNLHKNCHLSISKIIDACCLVCGLYMKTIRDVFNHCLEHAGIEIGVFKEELDHLAGDETLATEEEFVATKCQICKKEFRVLTELAAHIVSHEISLDNPVVCETCNGVFFVPETYVTHLGTCFDDSVRENDNDNRNNESEEDRATMVAMKNLPEDNETDSQNSNVEVKNGTGVDTITEVNIGVEVEIDAVVNEEIVVVDESDANKEIEQNKECTCVLCFHVFGNVNGLKHHILSKCSAIISLKCWNCYVEFPTKMELQKHWQSLMGQCKHVPNDDMDKYWPCEPCGEKYRDEAALEAHVADYHDAGSFKCRKCKKFFPYHYLLKAHEKVAHMGGGEKFCCIVCTATFDRFSSLEMHMTAHQLDVPRAVSATATTPAIKAPAVDYDDKDMETFCTYCDRNFFNARSLKNHLGALHGIGESSIKCDICGRQFSNNTNLKIHKRTHTEEKPYKCTMCPKTFSQGGNMRRHILTHGKGATPVPSKRGRKKNCICK